MRAKQVWYSPKTNTKSSDTIHQIFMFGELKDIESLKKSVGQTTLRELFLKHPKKIYTQAALNFVKNFILGINIPIDEQKYLKYTPRSIR